MCSKGWDYIPAGPTELAVVEVSLKQELIFVTTVQICLADNTVKLFIILLRHTDGLFLQAAGEKVYNKLAHKASLKYVVSMVN